MRQSCLLVGEAISLVAKNIKDGVTTSKLDRIAEEFIKDNGAIPSFKNYRGYPFTTCISANDMVVHGFPSNQALIDGDLISIDIGVFKNGLHGDSAYTFGVGNIKDEVKQLMKITKQALYKGIQKAVAGNRVGDIAFAIQEHTER